MKQSLRLFIFFLVFSCFSLAQNLPTTNSGAMSSLPKQATTFISNKGQWPAEVHYLAKAEGVNVWITETGARYDYYHVNNSTSNTSKNIDSSLNGHVIDLNLQGSKKEIFTGNHKTNTYHNYFLGSDKLKWTSLVPLYKEVKIDNLYQGINMRYYFDNNSVRYDYIIAPGADLSQIKMQLTGDDGVTINDQGELEIKTSLGVMKHAKIFAYQTNNNCKEEVACSFKNNNDGSFGFTVNCYDKTRPLIIDPLVWSTFIGGSSSDINSHLCTDNDNNTYITGKTYSSNFPTTTGAYDRSISYSYDIFISKLSADGTSLLFSTFIGGDGSDQGNDITVDALNNIYIVGETTHGSYPTTSGAYDESYNSNGYSDIIVTKLDSSGSNLLYSTFIGGNYNDMGTAITLDNNNNAYIVGRSSASNFPVTSGAYDETHNDSYGYDAVLARISADGSSLDYATYFGGNSNDSGQNVAIDASSNVYVTGFTRSTDFPTTSGAYDESHNGNDDIFVSKLDSSLSILSYSTLIGGSDLDRGHNIVLDTSNNIYVIGYSESANFPTTSGSYSENHETDADIIISKLNTNGTALLASTFIGGNDNDYG